MEFSDKVHGAYSKVYIQYKGTLQDLGSKLEDGLNIPALRYENMEDEPYDLVGYAEVFGFEVQLQELKNNGKWPEYQYSFEATTTDSFQEILNDHMLNISSWMARYIALMCEVTTMAENADKESGQSFYMNKNTSKRESSFVEANK
ncbi:hypothetical protein HQN90_25975 [Paenibacillus alba]|uniref:hypothetical protein n=1 Tax=Paenibacillus alba TaxID=1197127 RepID=UPI0015655D26|nr:hypothetical protein [Paenibacillus alba]NQX69586.1 hypothetical protein [Paenibacillus alba]